MQIVEKKSPQSLPGPFCQAKIRIFVHSPASEGMQYPAPKPVYKGETILKSV